MAAIASTPPITTSVWSENTTPRRMWLIR